MMCFVCGSIFLLGQMSDINNRLLMCLRRGCTVLYYLVEVEERVLVGLPPATLIQCCTQWKEINRPCKSNGRFEEILRLSNECFSWHRIEGRFSYTLFHTILDISFIRIGSRLIYQNGPLLRAVPWYSHQPTRLNNMPVVGSSLEWTVPRSQGL